MSTFEFELFDVIHPGIFEESRRAMMPKILGRCNCYICGKEMGKNNIKRHLLVCKARQEKKKGGGSKEDREEKEIQNRLAKLQKIQAEWRAGQRKKQPAKKKKKVGKAGGKKKGGGKKKAKKGTNFFLTFQETCKYDLQRYFHHRGHNWIKSLAAGNEWGSGYNGSGHTHAVVTTKEAMTFKRFEKKWKATTQTCPEKNVIEKVPLKYGDIQSCKKLKDAVRYVTKEDKQALCFDYDKDYCSILVRAYIYSQKCSTLRSTSYPYCHLVPYQQKQFRAYFNEFLEDERKAQEDWKHENLVLRGWQRHAKYKMIHQDERTVTWIWDPVGGIGKTTLAKYLVRNYNAIMTSNCTTTDFAFAFQSQRHVIFDFTREEKSAVNYSLIEQLKNGVLFSPKYESHVKSFPYCKILCLANFAPDLDKLSADRWDIWHLNEKGQLHSPSKVISKKKILSRIPPSTRHVQF